MANQTVEHRALAYARCFEQLSEERLEELEQFFAPTAHFKDPFNDVHGVQRIRRVFEHMYAACTEAGFQVLELSVSGQTAYLHWRFSYRLKRWQPQLSRSIVGVSRVRFNEQGEVVEHVDYWDAAEQVYEDIPLIGRLLRAIKGRLGTTVPPQFV